MRWSGSKTFVPFYVNTPLPVQFIHCWTIHVTFSPPFFSHFSNDFCCILSILLENCRPNGVSDLISRKFIHYWTVSALKHTQNGSKTEDVLFRQHFKWCVRVVNYDKLELIRMSAFTCPIRLRHSSVKSGCEWWDVYCCATFEIAKTKQSTCLLLTYAACLTHRMGPYGSHRATRDVNMNKMEANHSIVNKTNKQTTRKSQIWWNESNRIAVESEKEEQKKRRDFIWAIKMLRFGCGTQSQLVSTLTHSILPCAQDTQRIFWSLNHQSNYHTLEFCTILLHCRTTTLRRGPKSSTKAKLNPTRMNEH